MKHYNANNAMKDNNANNAVFIHDLLTFFLSTNTHSISLMGLPVVNFSLVKMYIQSPAHGKGNNNNAFYLLGIFVQDHHQKI